MATERPAKAKRILVVEDEPMIRMLLEDMLGELRVLLIFERAGNGRFFCGPGLPVSAAVDAAKISRSAVSQC